MKLFVISDTHGQLDKAKKVCDLADEADLIIHLGDNREDALRLSAGLGRPVQWVDGNCDWGKGQKNDHQILETDFGPIYLTHGHHEDVKFGLDKLLYKTESLGCKAAFFGHTHMAGFQQIKGIYLLNPGSLTFPRDGSRGSYAVACVSENHLEATIIYW